MQQTGISVVRLVESSWGLWEPQDGRFEYAWMDRVIDRMQKAGIKVILGTPTYSIPAWMYKEHPEIVITRFGGQTVTFRLSPECRFDNCFQPYRLTPLAVLYGWGDSPESNLFNREELPASPFRTDVWPRVTKE